MSTHVRLVNSMPPKAHLKPPFKTSTHTTMECDEILARGCPNIDITNAWLDERLRAMHSKSIDDIRSQLDG